ncbi:MAG TPA: hypothetical protein VFE62_08145 [Gemmataceae bacterium]|nr:hypothetical protein [Gemmataceae bacterium]
MSRLLVLLCAGLLLAAFSTNDALAQKKKIEITKKWSGSVADEKASKPAVITSAKGLEKVWKEWKAEGEVPKVDFDKNIIVTAYTVGSLLNVNAVNLDDNGNLTVLAIATRDFRPGFRYVLAVVRKDGVKTVEGKALPKE